MNIVTKHASEDMPRRAFTVADLRRMIDGGVLAEDERVELVEGDLIVMASKGYAHEIVRKELLRGIMRAVPDDVDVASEMTIEFADGILLEPDIVVMSRRQLLPSQAGFVRLSGADCALVVEIAASSLGYDQGIKARLYAQLGVRELWVVDPRERRTWIHTGPRGEGWSSIVEHGPDSVLTTPAVPDFSIRLRDIQ